MRSTTSVRRTLLHPTVTYPHYSCLVSSNTTTDFLKYNPQSRLMVPQQFRRLAQPGSPMKGRAYPEDRARDLPYRKCETYR
ncbi:hypothetical protein TNCV_266711 [Trichonephila clavipes]|nr:hypothetical protein TNCV_266711 [Trichonephila clavipes]